MKEKPLFFFCPFLIGRDTVSIDNAAADSVLLLPASVARVTLNGVNNAVFALLYNAHVVYFAVALPIKEDDLTCRRLKVVVLPLPTVFEPLPPVDAACEFWYHATVDIAAFIRTPTHKAGAPFCTPVKALPRPIGLTAHIADLRQGNGHDFAVTNGDTIKHRRPERIVFLGK